MSAKVKSVSFGESSVGQKRPSDGGDIEDAKRAKPLDPDACVLTQFTSEGGEPAGPPVKLPLSLAKSKLQLILNKLLKEEDTVPYSFFVDEREVTKDLNGVLPADFCEEQMVTVVYQAQAVFKVSPVTRCASSLPGHADAVLCAALSTDGRTAVTGSGDTTVRLWDTDTDTPINTGREHADWVLAAAWSPDGEKLATGCKRGQVSIWDPATGKTLGKSFKLHKKPISTICWEPLHLSTDGRCNRVATASFDGSIRIWNVNTFTVGIALSGHTQPVSCLRWSGEGFLYSGSRDTTLKVWRASDGALCSSLSQPTSMSGHSHWVNTLALNTDYVMRTGHQDPKDLMKVTAAPPLPVDQRVAAAKARYSAVLAAAGGVERLCSGSDDFSLCLWEPHSNKKQVCRMSGHQQLVNDVKFSPDMRLIASASFDKSLRLWNGVTGKFMAVLRGHVAAVYCLAWSADSRMLVSGGKDSTLKVWSVKDKGLLLDLPGHADEVNAVDWSPDGRCVVSGSKDKLVKIWRQ